MISKLDFIAIPSRNGERSRELLRRHARAAAGPQRTFEAWIGETCSGFGARALRHGVRTAEERPSRVHVDDVAAARAELEAQGVVFTGETLDTGVCQMAFFTDPDGNDLMLHHRYAGYDPAPAAHPADDT